MPHSDASVTLDADLLAQVIDVLTHGTPGEQRGIAILLRGVRDHARVVNEERA